MEYVIRELQQEPDGFAPDADPTPRISNVPTLSKPTLQNPTQTNSALGNWAQLNKEKAINDLSNTESNPIPPQTPLQQTPLQTQTQNLSLNPKHGIVNDYISMTAGYG